MLFAFLSLLLAQVVCVDNGDGTWTCSGQGYSGITTNEQGQASCTNCVNMSPAECRQKRDSLISDLSDLQGNLMSLVSFASEKAAEVGVMADDYRGFSDCPYGFNYSSGQPFDSPSVAQLITGSNANTFDNYTAAANTISSGFNNSLQVEKGYLDSIPSQSFAVSQSRTPAFSAYCWNIASQWHGSYRVASQVAPALDRASSALGQCSQQANSMQSDVVSILSTAESINCAPCVLGDGDGGSGSGTQVGCLECYLVFLRRYTEQLDLLNVQVSALTNIQMRILSEVKDINSILPSISNHVGRIDDYLWTDQSNMLANVEAAIIVISNNVDTIQQYYFHTFSNASDISMGVYGGDANGRELTMEEVFNRIFKPQDQGGFQLSEYEKYDWFRRIELQLSQITGIFSETNVESLSDSDYNSMKDAVENLEDLSDGVSSSGGSVVSVGSSLRSAAQTIGSIFPSSAPLGEITLLEARYWIGDTDFVLRTDFQVVSFCRVLFGLIWVTLACVGLWLLLSRSWVILFDIFRWLCNWFPKIFGN